MELLAIHDRDELLHLKEILHEILEFSSLPVQLQLDIHQLAVRNPLCIDVKKMLQKNKDNFGRHSATSYKAYFG